MAVLKKLGANSYRFSIAWPRVIPQGGKDDPVNEAGLQFYDDLIDELLAAGIEPFVVSAKTGLNTDIRLFISALPPRECMNKLILSWDLPLALQKRYEGWLSRDVIPDYCRYAKLCFDRYGDRVKNWLTFNEPWCVAVLGNGIGQFAP